MKLFTTILFFLAFNYFGFCQKKTNYNQFKNEIQQNKYSKDLKLNKTISFLNNNEMYVSELIDICNFFTREKIKYKICLNAYSKIIDKKNFFEVYDVFNSFSYAIKLYHKTQGNNLNVQVEITYPNYTDYGVVNNNCNQPMTNHQFKKLINNMRSSSNLIELKQIIRNRCFSTKQIMLLGERLNSDNNRYDFFTHAFNYTADISNYYYTKQLISDRKQKEDLDYFINEKIDFSQNQTQNNNCDITPRKFNYILKVIKDEPFSKAKLKLAKQLIIDNCVNLKQFRAIVNEFSFDNDKLNLLKYSFDYVKRQKSYYTLRNVLKFNSSKKKFDLFLLSKK